MSLSPGKENWAHSFRRLERVFSSLIFLLKMSNKLKSVKNIKETQLVTIQKVSAKISLQRGKKAYRPATGCLFSPLDFGLV